MHPLFAYAGVCCAACVMYQVIFTAITGVGEPEHLILISNCWEPEYGFVIVASPELHVMVARRHKDMREEHEMSEA